MIEPFSLGVCSAKKRTGVLIVTSGAAPAGRKVFAALIAKSRESTHTAVLAAFTAIKKNTSQAADSSSAILGTRKLADKVSYGTRTRYRLSSTGTTLLYGFTVFNKPGTQ